MSLLTKLRANNKLAARERNCVQYGCGFSAPKEWINFDSSPTLRFERVPILGHLYTKNQSRFPREVLYGDIVKGLPFPDNSCDAIYASHVLEHLSLSDFRVALKNTYGLLRSGGTFRLIVPDLRSLARRYIETESEFAGKEFMRATGLGVEKRPSGFVGILSASLGNNAHLWMWDEKGLAAELSSVGFKNVRRCEFGDSPDSAFVYVESKDRFVDAVAMEAQRP